LGAPIVFFRLKDEEDVVPQSKGVLSFIYIYMKKINNINLTHGCYLPHIKIDEGENEQLYNVLTFTCISTTLKGKKVLNPRSWSPLGLHES
jgi:hypothetical protein